MDFIFRSGEGIIALLHFIQPLRSAPFHINVTSMSDDGNYDELTGSEVVDRELVRLWRAWRTVNQMCQDRVCLSSDYTKSLRLSLFKGYELSDEEVNISLNDFRRKHSDNGIPRYVSIPHRIHYSSPSTAPSTATRGARHLHQISSCTVSRTKS